jgi:hypothetical protein
MRAAAERKNTDVRGEFPDFSSKLSLAFHQGRCVCGRYAIYCDRLQTPRV